MHHTLTDWWVMKANLRDSAGSLLNKGVIRQIKTPSNQVKCQVISKLTQKVHVDSSYAHIIINTTNMRQQEIIS